MSAGIKRRNGIRNSAAVLRLLFPMVALSSAAAQPPLTEEWPARPLTLVVPFTAGGGTDVTARLQAQAIGDVLGQNVIVENIGGGAGMTAGVRVARAAPDGYTVLIGNTGTHAYNQTLYKGRSTMLSRSGGQSRSGRRGSAQIDALLAVRLLYAAIAHANVGLVPGMAHEIVGETALDFSGASPLLTVAVSHRSACPCSTAYVADCSMQLLRFRS
jgi:hypothetical protein